MNEKRPFKRDGEEFERFFQIGDLVKVDGFGDQIFRIDGYIYSQMRYTDESWNELEYELSDVEDESWIDAFEEDMTLVAPAVEAERFLRRFFRNSNKKQNKLTKKQKINALLDEYNDYRRLYDEFGDAKYKGRMTRLKNMLRKHR